MSSMLSCCGRPSHAQQASVRLRGVASAGLANRMLTYDAGNGGLCQGFGNQFLDVPANASLFSGKINELHHQNLRLHSC